MRLLALSLAVAAGFSTMAYANSSEQSLQASPAKLLPHNSLYHSRQSFTDAEKRAFDYIVTQLGTWQDNAAELGTTTPMKTIDLRDQSVNLPCTSLTTVLMRMRDDVQHVYAQYPPGRNVVCANDQVQQFDLRYHRSPSFADYQTEIAQIEAKANEFLAKLKPDMTEAQKVRVLHDELLALVSYGQLKPGPDDIRGAFIHNSVLCEGYARTLVYLLQLAGLDALYVAGDVDGGLHAWLKVKVDGLWYNIDPTWNDGRNSFHHDYFLIADANFTSHVPSTSRFAIPVPTTDLATSDYPLADTVYTPPAPDLPSAPESDDTTGDENDEAATPKAPAQYEVPTIYTVKNYVGESMQFTDDVAELGEFALNIGSITVPTGWQVRFFQEPNFEGGYYTRGWLSGGLGSGGGFGHIVRSVKVLQKPNEGVTTDPNTLTIYNGVNHSGERLEISHDLAQFDSVFDDNVASYKIPEGWFIRFYEEPNFEGRYYTRSAGASDEPDFTAYGLKASSVRILRK